MFSSGTRPCDPLVREAQQALAADHLEQLLGHVLARQRPQPFAGPAGHDQHITHGRKARGTGRPPGRVTTAGHARPRGYAPGVPLIAELLARRVRSDGARRWSPTTTSTPGAARAVRDHAGQLGGQDEQPAERRAAARPRGAVELLVAVHHPGHWMTLVWALACWQTGAAVTLGRPDEAALVVSGPAGDVEPGTAELVACSLHPLGLGLGRPCPTGVVDYTAEVRGQPDRWSVGRVARTRRPGATTAHARPGGPAGGGPGPARRLLVRPGSRGRRSATPSSCRCGTAVRRSCWRAPPTTSARAARPGRAGGRRRRRRPAGSVAVDGRVAGRPCWARVTGSDVPSGGASVAGGTSSSA